MEKNHDIMKEENISIAADVLDFWWSFDEPKTEVILLTEEGVKERQWLI